MPMDFETGRDGLVAQVEDRAVALMQMAADKSGVPMLQTLGTIHECRLPYIYKHGLELRCANPLGHNVDEPDMVIKSDFGEQQDVQLIEARKQHPFPDSDAEKFHENLGEAFNRRKVTIEGEVVAADEHWVGVVELDDGTKHRCSAWVGMPPGEVDSMVAEWMDGWAKAAAR